MQPVVPVSAAHVAAKVSVERNSPLAYTFAAVIGGVWLAAFGVAFVYDRYFAERHGADDPFYLGVMGLGVLCIPVALGLVVKARRWISLSTESLTYQGFVFRKKIPVTSIRAAYWREARSQGIGRRAGSDFAVREFRVVVGERDRALFRVESPDQRLSGLLKELTDRKYKARIADEKPASLTWRGFAVWIAMIATVVLGERFIDRYKKMKSEQESERQRQDEAFMNTSGGEVCEEHPEWSREICVAVANHRVVAGMTGPQVRESIGAPAKVEQVVSAEGIDSIWSYASGVRVRVHNGAVAGIMNAPPTKASPR